MPVIMPIPNTPKTPRDRDAIVRFVAFKLLRSELDWSASDVYDTYPELAGITVAELDAVIAEGLL